MLEEKRKSSSLTIAELASYPLSKHPSSLHPGIINKWEAVIQNRETSLVLCDNLEGWDGEGGREAQEGGNIVYTHTHTLHTEGFPGSTSGKEPACQCRNVGDIRDVGFTPGSGISPGRGHGNPVQYSCLENPHGQRSLAGYSP